MVNKKASKDTLLELGLDEVRSSGMFSSYQVVNNNVWLLLAVWYREAPVILADETNRKLWTLKLLEYIVELLKSLTQKTGNVSSSSPTVKKWHKRQILHLS